MFSNRFYYTKLIASLAIVLASCVYSYVVGLSINPAFWQCKLKPDAYNGTELWVPFGMLVSGDDKIFIKYGRYSIPAIGNIDKNLIGKSVSVTGKFIKGTPSYIEIKEIKRTPFQRARPYIEIVSLIVFCYVAILFVRVFAIKLRHIFEAK